MNSGVITFLLIITIPFFLWLRGWWNKGELGRKITNIIFLLVDGALFIMLFMDMVEHVFL